MEIKTAFIKLGRKIAEHSPAIYTTAGIVGVGVTAYLAYECRDKVEKVKLNLEERRENGEEIDKVEVVKEVAKAVYLPVTVGVLSCASILAAHKIQNKRIIAVAGALVAEQTRSTYFENKYRKEHGEEAYNKFIRPTERVEKEVDGRISTKEVAHDTNPNMGQWFNESDLYEFGDHEENVELINSVNERMKDILFQRGSLLLNEVREALGFKRTMSGALLGWRTGDKFEIITNVAFHDDGIENKTREEIWVSWTKPGYIYNKVEFNSRYSAY